MKNVVIEEKLERPESIRAVLRDASINNGDKIAYKYFDKNNNILEMSYKRVYALFKAFGESILNLGLSKTKIALLAENRPEWIIAYCSCISSGNVIVPLDKELMPAQVENFINYSGAEAVICSDKYISAVMSMDLPGLKYIISFDGSPEEGGSDKRIRYFSELTARADTDDNHFRTIRFDKNKMSALIFTSGTTGTSKGVMLSEDNLLENIYAASNMICFSPDTVLLSVLPMHHTYETSCGQLTALRLGLTICINNSLKYFMKNVALFQPTAMVLVPLFVVTIRKKIQEEIKKRKLEKLVNAGVKTSRLIGKIGLDTRKLLFSKIRAPLGGRLKDIIVGGAAIDADTINWFADIGIQVSQGYGITECAPLVAVNPLVTLDPACVGMPIPGSKVKIIDTDESGNEYELSCGEIGEICVKGRNVMIGYYNSEEATVASFTEEGYFKTGDFGYVNEKGYIFITGRKKNIIVLQNGKNVYPEEIEEYLEKIEEIKECVVVGRTKEGGEVVLTALIYPDFDKFKGKSEDEIVDCIRARVAGINKKLPIFKQVRNIELKKSEFEKTTTQKIIRYKLS
ncbi:MAG: AMP-binding protein [Clostridia bacterium]|nr:AMP-binding protein [Clostridia bacterium]